MSPRIAHAKDAKDGKGGGGRRGGERMIFNFGFWIEEEMLTQRTQRTERKIGDWGIRYWGLGIGSKV